jgi:hypothetical protein
MLTKSGSLLRFIPFRKKDVIEMCLSSNQLNQHQRQQFRRVTRMIERLIHLSFQTRIEALKDTYACINPDSDTVRVELPTTMNEGAMPFSHQLEALLEKANYEPIDQSTLQLALKESSLFKVQLAVDFNDFSEVLLFSRGLHEKEEVVTRFWGLQKKTVRFENFERVALYIRLNEHLDTKRKKEFNLEPGSVILKLFKDVPKADLEMLFPNTEIRMRIKDKLLIGIPAAISGGMVISTKLGSTLLLLASLFGFWLGFHTSPVEIDKAALIALFAGLGAFASYLFKQVSNFKNRKLQFVQSLTKNLYFKNLDNNAGVFHRLLDDAEEEECKEAILAYYFLLTAEQPLTKPQLDQRIEHWLEEEWRSPINFEIDDAINKLKAFGLIKKADNFRLTPASLEEAHDCLVQQWQEACPKE